MNALARPRWILGCAALLAACGSSGAPGQPLVENPMLQRWCGTHPCTWTTSGETKRVGTWHPDDYAIELVGDDAAVTQLNADVTDQQSGCFAFSLTADISPDTQVFLELDFFDDGVIDFQEPVPALHWERKTFDITPPTSYEGVRFIVRKAGPGHAIVAQLEVVNNGWSCTAPPIVLKNQPSDICTASSNCAEGEVCGKTLQRNLLVDMCTLHATRQFGEVCSLDEQCESDVCNDGVCSECSATSPCSNGGACALPKLLAATRDNRGIPSQCSSGQHLRAAGDQCTDPTDCKSGTCSGSSVGCALRACADPQAACSKQCIQSRVVPGMCR